MTTTKSTPSARLAALLDGSEPSVRGPLRDLTTVDAVRRRLTLMRHAAAEDRRLAVVSGMIDDVLTQFDASSVKNINDTPELVERIVALDNLINQFVDDADEHLEAEMTIEEAKRRSVNLAQRYRQHVQDPKDDDAKAIIAIADTVREPTSQQLATCRAFAGERMPNLLMELPGGLPRNLRASDALQMMIDYWTERVQDPSRVIHAEDRDGEESAKVQMPFRVAAKWKRLYEEAAELEGYSVNSWVLMHLNNAAIEARYRRSLMGEII